MLHQASNNPWTDSPGRIGQKWGVPVKEVKTAIENLKGSPGARVRGGSGPRRNPDIEINVDTGDVRIKGGDGDVVDNLHDYLDEYRELPASRPGVDWGPLVGAVGAILVIVGTVAASPLQVATG